MRHLHASMSVAALFLLAACSESAGPGITGASGASEKGEELPIDLSIGCRNDFAVPGADTNWICAACGTPKDVSNAIDGVRETYAEIPFPANVGAASVGTAGAVTIRATLPEGVTYPAGSIIGAIVRPAAGTAYSETISFATYLNGVPQDYFPGSVASITGVGNYPDQKRTEIARLAFDAVELIYSAEGGAVTSSFRLYEFCSE